MLVKSRLSADTMRMSARSLLAALACTAALLAPAALALPAAAGAHSVGTPAQIAWVRSAATRFVAAELAASGANACAVLNAPLRATEHGRTCAQRWNISEPGARANLRAQKRAIATATVLVHGNAATIELPAPLMGGANRFAWSENCWMLAS
jgi:hypothetical protein